MTRALRFAAIALLVVLSACHSDAGHDEHSHPVELEASAAKTYLELRTTPRGKSSGFAVDIQALREEGLQDPVEFERTRENIDLERRARLRAYEGAPPVIPHEVRQDSAAECLACHNERVTLRGRTVRPISHQVYTSCTQCHVASRAPMPAVLSPDPRSLGNTFAGMRVQAPNREKDVLPPRIPHRTAMRDRCQSCHGMNGPDRGHHPVDFKPERELPKSFVLSEDGKLQCTTCHSVSDRVPPLQDVNAPVAAPKPAGSDLCLDCHEASHEPVFARLGLTGGAHLGGSDLDKILSERIRPDKGRTGCLGCHGSHGALQQGVLKEAREGRACAVCHLTQALGERNHPIGGPAQRSKTIPADIPTGKEGEPLCRSCHDLVGGDEGDHLVRKREGPLCMACHTDRVEAMRDGAHGKVRGERGEPCLGCHELHDNSRDSHLLATVANASASDPAGCLSCHGPGRIAAPKNGRPGVEGHPVDGKHHEGLDAALTCVSCHDAHEPDPSEIKCGSCHEDKDDAFARGGHGTAQCLDCHPTHREAARAPISDENPSARRCLACHDNELGEPGIKHVAEYKHPAPMFTPGGARWEPLGALPLFGPDGNQVPDGANGDLTCSTCHLTHGPDSSRASDRLRRPGWQAVCSACHGDETLLVYRYFHKRDRLAGRGEQP